LHSRYLFPPPAPLPLHFFAGPTPTSLVKSFFALLTRNFSISARTFFSFLLSALSTRILSRLSYQRKKRRPFFPSFSTIFIRLASPLFPIFLGRDLRSRHPSSYSANSPFGCRFFLLPLPFSLSHTSGHPSCNSFGKCPSLGVTLTK